MKFFLLMTKLFTKVVPLTFKYWWLAVTFLVFLPSVAMSIQTGLENGDLKEPMKDLGVLLVSSDEVIYEKLVELEYDVESKEGILGRLLFIMDFLWFIFRNFWRELWMMVFVFFVFYKGFVFFGGESVRGVRATILSLLSMAFVQVMVQGIPFKGMYSLLKFLMREAL